MGWTMTLKDDFGVIAWTRRTGNFLSLFLLLSLFSFSLESDIVFPKDHHFSWKAGKTFISSFFAMFSFLTIEIETSNLFRFYEIHLLYLFTSMNL